MTVIWMGLGGIALACMAAGFVVGMLAERSHRERVEFDAEIAQHEKRLKAKQAGRHAKSQPRASTSPAPAAVTPDPKPAPAGLVQDWYRDLKPASAPEPAKPSLGGAISVFLASHMDAVTAENIDTVLLADPSPAPPVTGAADTGTMTKVSITSTGDMPALTDSFIADLELREAAYRKEHAESEA